MEKVEVETSVGTWTIIKPKAGVRNRALAKAETSDGNFKRVFFLSELLPKCVNKRPENFDPDVPIEQVLDDLSMEDYDCLSDALTKLIVPDEEESIDSKKN